MRREKRRKGMVKRAVGDEARKDTRKCSASRFGRNASIGVLIGWFGEP